MREHRGVGRGWGRWGPGIGARTLVAHLAQWAARNDRPTHGRLRLSPEPASSLRTGPEHRSIGAECSTSTPISSGEPLTSVTDSNPGAFLEPFLTIRLPQNHAHPPIAHVNPAHPRVPTPGYRSEARILTSASRTRCLQAMAGTSAVAASRRAAVRGLRGLVLQADAGQLLLRARPARTQLRLAKSPSTSPTTPSASATCRTTSTGGPAA